MAAEQIAATERRDIRFICCKRCGCHIDDGGLCGYGCDFDNTPLGQRDPNTVEVVIYQFTRTEPYTP